MEPTDEDRKRHNEWVMELATEIEFDPLREFVLRLLEPEHETGGQEKMKPTNNWCEAIGMQCVSEGFWRFTARFGIKVEVEIKTLSILWVEDCEAIFDPTCEEVLAVLDALKVAHH